MNMTGLAELLSRRQKLKAYRAERQRVEALSDAELADIGLKRYQLGHVARVKVLG
jgi:uncharacterized protein YjiS (DUF1127 family)